MTTRQHAGFRWACPDCRCIAFAAVVTWAVMMLCIVAVGSAQIIQRGLVYVDRDFQEVAVPLSCNLIELLAASREWERRSSGSMSRLDEDGPFSRWVWTPNDRAAHQRWRRAVEACK